MNSAPTERGVQEILRSRARALARRPAEDRVNGTVEMIVLMVAGERYGIELARLVEALPFNGLARVPGLGPAWAGVANVRGRLVAVLDLARHLGLPASPTPTERMLVLVETPGRPVALLVDHVTDARRIGTGDLMPPLSAGPHRAGIVSAVSRDGIAVLDVDATVAFHDASGREEGK